MGESNELKDMLFAICGILALIIIPVVIGGIVDPINARSDLEHKSEIENQIVIDAKKFDSSMTDDNFFQFLGSKIATLEKWEWMSGNIGEDGLRTYTLFIENPAESRSTERDLGYQSYAQANYILSILGRASGLRFFRARFFIHVRWTDENSNTADWVAAITTQKNVAANGEYVTRDDYDFNILEDTASGKYFKVVGVSRYRR